MNGEARDYSERESHARHEQKGLQKNGDNREFQSTERAIDD